MTFFLFLFFYIKGVTWFVNEEAYLVLLLILTLCVILIKNRHFFDWRVVIAPVLIRFFGVFLSFFFKNFGYSRRVLGWIGKEVSVIKIVSEKI
jgi:nucleoside permease NupC